MSANQISPDIHAEGWKTKATKRNVHVYFPGKGEKQVEMSQFPPPNKTFIGKKTVEDQTGVFIGSDKSLKRA